MDIEKIDEFRLERVDHRDDASEVWLTHHCGFEKEIEFKWNPAVRERTIPMDHVLAMMEAHSKACKG
jgi:hypothetical protein